MATLANQPKGVKREEARLTIEEEFRMAVEGSIYSDGCPACGWEEVMGTEPGVVEPVMDVVQARNALWRRCKDAGWSDRRAQAYLDRVLPWPAETSISG